MGRLATWFGRNEVIGWVGVAVGIAQLLVSLQLAWGTLLGLAGASFGLVLSGGLIVLISIGRRERNPIVAEQFNLSMDFEGDHGQKAILREKSSLHARTTVQSFPYSITRADGSRAGQTILFRNLGSPKARKTDHPKFYSLRHEHLFTSVDKSMGTILKIMPPVALEKNDVVEIENEEIGKDCFPGEDEYIEKTILFPIKRLHIELRFPKANNISNCSGSKLENGIPSRFEALQPTTKGEKLYLEWDVENASLGEGYRVSWRW